MENYIFNIENSISNILFYSFIGCLCLIVIELIISLIMLIIGCLIKSQTIRSKFLRIVPISLFFLILLLSIPKIGITIKSLF